MGSECIINAAIDLTMTMIMIIIAVLFNTIDTEIDHRLYTSNMSSLNRETETVGGERETERERRIKQTTQQRLLT